MCSFTPKFHAPPPIFHYVHSSAHFLSLFQTLAPSLIESLLQGVLDLSVAIKASNGEANSKLTGGLGTSPGRSAKAGVTFSVDKSREQGVSTGASGVQVKEPERVLGTSCRDRMNLCHRIPALKDKVIQLSTALLPR